MSCSMQNLAVRDLQGAQLKAASRAKNDKLCKKSTVRPSPLKPHFMRLSGIFTHRVAQDHIANVYPRCIDPEKGIELGKLSEREICELAKKVLNHPSVRLAGVLRVFLDQLRGSTIPKSLSRANLTTRAFMLQAALGVNDVWIFTLRLGKEDIERALRQESRSFSVEIARKINMELKKRGLATLRYWFMVEAASSTKELHIHGAFRAPNHIIEKVKESLESVGRRYRQRWNNRALDIQKPKNGFNWAQYCTKDEALTKRVYGEKLGTLWKASPEVKQMSKDWYSLFRVLLSNSADVLLRAPSSTS